MNKGVDMKVKELIELLQTFPQDMLVARELYSEAVVMSSEDVAFEVLCKPRADGWVENKRPDKESMTYVVFAGN